MAVAAAHPSIEELAAFTLGTLADGAHLAIEAHVAVCDFCQERAAVAPGDALIDLLRSAHARTGNQDDTSVAAADMAQTPAPVAALPVTMAHRSAPSTDPDADVPPPELTRLQRYRVTRRLGAGGMGAVYQAEHRVMQRTVALKVIHPSFVINANARELFRREVRAAARLCHPNIVTTYDAEDSGDTHFLVMEYVEGVNLGRLVQERRPLSVAEACAAVRQAALGLQHAHERGMVHRDVKPGNLIRCADGTVKLLDFGLAALTAERDDERASGLTEDNVVMGTPDYMAPEQAEDPRSADIRADVYSLGCTLYHLLTGNVPYPAATSMQKIVAHRERPLPQVRRLRPEVAPALAAVLARMLARQPRDRYQTPLAVADALAPFTHPERVARLEPAMHRPVRFAIAVAALCAALLIAGAVYRIRTDQGELVITTESDDVDVVLKQAGKIVRVVDVTTDKQVVLSLHSGVYELELNGAQQGLKLDIDKAALTRGATVLAKIERVPKGASATDAPAVQVIQPLHRIAWQGGERFSAVDVTQDGRLFLAACLDGKVYKTRVWDMQTGALRCELNGFVARFTPDGGHVITMGWNDFCVCELSTGNVVRRFESPEHCWNFYLSAAGTILHAVTARNHEIYDWNTGEQLCQIPWHGNARAFLTRDGRYLLRQPDDGPPLQVVDTATGKDVAALGQLRNLPPLRGISADGNRLICEEDRHDKILDAATGKQVADLGRVTLQTALSGNGRLALHTTNRRDDYAVRDIESGRILARLQFPESFTTLWDIRVSWDGRYAVFAGAGNFVHVFRLPDVTAANTQP
jgi:serine/threonine protein kinase